MAHFAKLDDNNVVTQVIVVANDELLDNGVESEAKGIAFCQSLFGGNWKQTSYNGNMRKNYASIGFTYDVGRDAFIPPQPYLSWILNQQSCLWEAPIAKPNDIDGFIWKWSEINKEWIKVAI